MTLQRTCDGCTECCKGWLPGDALGQTFYRGKPCFYLAESKCSVYEDRPADPCKSYTCEWLATNDLPMWMRPDLSHVIVTKRIKDGIEFYDLIETDRQIDSAVLSWFFLWTLNGQRNLMYQVKGGVNRIGSPEFLALQFQP